MSLFSATTKTRGIDEMALRHGLEMINVVPLYLIPVDDSTGVDKAILLVLCDISSKRMCIRIYHGRYFCLPTPQLQNYLNAHVSRRLNRSFCVGVSTDGVTAPWYKKRLGTAALESLRYT